MRRVGPRVVAVLACLLAASGCGGAAAVRTAQAGPLPPASAAPSRTGAPARSASGLHAASPQVKPAASRSTSGPAAPATPPAPSHSRPATPAPSTAPVPPAAPMPATGRGPGGSITNTGTDAVALTFDDGPDPTYTPQLLDLLKAQGVKATFCVVGTRVRSHPELVRRIVAEGHTLCNHSWQHLDLSRRDESFVLHDLQATSDAIHAAVPDAPIEYFRAPYGNFTPQMVRIAANLGMKPIYWSVDDQCWMTSTYGTGPAMVDHIAAMVRHGTRPGGIILSHDIGKPQTVAAYRSLLPWLTSRYHLEALPTSQPHRPAPETPR